MNQQSLASELNENQIRAVLHRGSHLLMVAGAGSGKTRTLTFRAASLVSEFNPAELMIVTFTKKAATELQERLARVIPAAAQKDLRRATIGTFHSACRRMLMAHGELVGLKPNWGILDQEDTHRVMASAARLAGIGSTELVRDLESLHGFARNSMERWEILIDTGRFSALAPVRTKVGAAFDIYTRRCRQSNRVDFDDMLVLAMQLLQRPDMRQYYAGQYKSIMVDEYQDTSRIQAKILELLAGRDNVTVVGDDAQAIYGFRAATVENILEFQRKFSATVVPLDTNYRSTDEIVALSNESIGKNTRQIKKVMRAVGGRGNKPVFLVGLDPQGEAELVWREMKLAMDAGISRDQIAVLVRATRLSAQVEVLLKLNKIPYVVVGGQDFFSLEHVKIVIDILRLTVNPADTIALGNVQDFVELADGAVIERIETQVARDQTSIWEVLQQLQTKSPRLTELANHAAKLMALPSGSDVVTKAVLETLSYLAPALKKRFQGERKDEVDQDHATLVGITKQFTSVSEFVNTVSLEQFVDEDKASGEAPITISTIHSAKGLEWDAVFVMGMVEFWFPLNIAIKQSGSDEEERRLFYVAATRARKRLFLSSYRQSMTPTGRIVSSTVSRFISELNQSTYSAA